MNAPTNPRADGDAAAVEQAERARLQRMLARDLDTLGPMLDEDLIYTHSSGVVHDRAEYLALMAASDLMYEDIAIEPRVTMVGGAGVLHARMRARIRMDGQQRDLRGSYLAVWGLRDGRWTLRALQSTSASA